MYNPQIKTFITVADAGSFNRAAELLFISSTAVIKQINLLENHIEVQLFNRSHKGLTLTPAGRVFYKDAKQFISIGDTMIRRVRELQQGISDVIRIGSSPITPVDILTSLATKLQDSGIQFQIIPFENNPENAKQILDNLGKNIDVVMGIFEDVTKEFYRKIQTLTVDRLTVKLLMASTDILVNKSKIDWNDFKNRRVYILESKWTTIFDEVAHSIQIHEPETKIVRFPFLDTNIFNKCLQDNGIMVGFSIWNKVHPFIVVKDMDWSFTINYGVLYSKVPSEPVNTFIKIVKQELVTSN